MRETFNEIINYIKNPILEKDGNLDNAYRLRKFFNLLIISILTGAILSPIFLIIEKTGLVNFENHAMEEMMRTMSKIVIFIFVVIVAPLIEELIFRAPITLFQNTKSFKIAFYVFALIFGLIHLTNFTITTNVLILAPLLVLPQIILGAYLGFIRVRFGLAWSILLHACYNAFFILGSFASDLI